MPLVDTGGTAFRLADAVGLVEEVIAVAQRFLCVLIDRNGDRLDVLIAVTLSRGPLPVAQRPLYALAVHPPHRVPAALNGFGLWNVLVLVLMLLAYGYPIAQFVIEPSPAAMVHRMH